MHYRLMGIAAAFILVFLTLVFAGANLSLREGTTRVMASEARFGPVPAVAPEAVFVFDPETRRIMGANPFMAKWLGYGRRTRRRGDRPDPAPECSGAFGGRSW